VGSRSAPSVSVREGAQALLAHSQLLPSGGAGQPAERDQSGGPNGGHRGQPPLGLAFGAYMLQPVEGAPGGPAECAEEAADGLLRVAAARLQGVEAKVHEWHDALARIDRALHGGVATDGPPALLLGEGMGGAESLETVCRSLERLSSAWDASRLHNLEVRALTISRVAAAAAGADASEEPELRWCPGCRGLSSPTGAPVPPAPHVPSRPATSRGRLQEGARRL